MAKDETDKDETADDDDEGDIEDNNGRRKRKPDEAEVEAERDVTPHPVCMYCAWCRHLPMITCSF